MVKENYKILLRISVFIIFTCCLPVGKVTGTQEDISHIFLPIIPNNSEIIYSSTNLEGHSIFGECNPGDGTSCPCNEQLDASIHSFASYGEVTSNPRLRNTYVNAIGFKKFSEFFPDGTPISLGKYRYLGQFRLSTLPTQNTNQVENAQAIHLMIQLWDGRNVLYQADEHTLEGAIYWVLNPWEADYGKIKVYTNAAAQPETLELKDSGITLPPDTNWHAFELIVDLDNQTYISVSIDGYKQDLGNIALAKVHQPTWGKDIALSITTESMATWPKYTCLHVFTWTTQFKDLKFHQIQG